MTDTATRATTSRAAAYPRRVVPALLGYAAVRALGLLVLAGWSAARDKSAHTLLTARWDALWYARVADGGYGYEVRLPNGDVHSDLAFFPLLPWLERGLHALTPLSYADAGFAVSLVASLAAAWGIHAVADHVYGSRAAVCAVLLWAVLPVGIVQSMAYSESLFTALAAWSLYAVLTGRWVTAGTLAALAGLTRPVGLAVVAAVWVAGIAPFVRQRRAVRIPGARAGERAPGPSGPGLGGRVPRTGGARKAAHAPPAEAVPSTLAGLSTPAAEDVPPTPPGVAGPAAGAVPPASTAFSASAASLPDSFASPETVAQRVSFAALWRRALGLLVAPLGAAGYVLWVGRRTGGGPLGYLDVQAGWRNGFDGGYAFARFTADKFTSFPAALAGVGLILGVALAIWLYVTGVRQGQPLPLLVYTGVVTALALCASSYFGSKPRLLLPAFPLLLPLARSLAAARPSRSALVTAALALAAALYGAFWLNGTGPP